MDEGFKVILRNSEEDYIVSVGTIKGSTSFWVEIDSVNNILDGVGPKPYNTLTDEEISDKTLARFDLEYVKKTLEEYALYLPQHAIDYIEQNITKVKDKGQTKAQAAMILDYINKIEKADLYGIASLYTDYYGPLNLTEAIKLNKKISLESLASDVDGWLEFNFKNSMLQNLLLNFGCDKEALEFTFDISWENSKWDEDDEGFHEKVLELHGGEPTIESTIKLLRKLIDPKY